MGKEIVEHVRRRLFDAQRGAAWADRNTGYARGVDDALAFGAETSRRLAQLETSHVGWFSIDDPAHAALREIFHATLSQPPTEVDSIGVEVDGHGVVRRVLAGGAAEKAGLRRGDRILEANGRPFHAVRSIRARAVQRHGRGSVVGQRTAGAVVGGQCLPLSDGSLLYLAVVDVLVDGERLEGIGVTPCMAVPDDLPAIGDPISANDPTLIAGLAEAVRLVRSGAAD